jgi:hypothetical protein
MQSILALMGSLDLQRSALVMLVGVTEDWLWEHRSSLHSKPSARAITVQDVGEWMKRNLPEAFLTQLTSGWSLYISTGGKDIRGGAWHLNSEGTEWNFLSGGFATVQPQSTVGGQNTRSPRFFKKWW